MELLLCDASPALRYRVLTELLDVPLDDPEAADLASRRLLPDGAGAGLTDLVWLMCRAAYAGFDRAHPVVAGIAEKVLAWQLDDGSFPLSAFRSRGQKQRDRYAMIPLQASLPLRGLAAAGYALDPRVERGYEWLLDQRLDDGAWPTGRAAGQPGYVAGYRRLPGSRGCRANTQAALAGLVLHPTRRRSEDTRRALDLLLQRETRDEWALGSEVSRLVGIEPATGFITFYARFDLAFVLEIAARAGASAEDDRVADLVAFLERLRGPDGLWEHPTHPELSRWLTFDILLNLRRLTGGDWAGTAPRIPFRPRPAAR